MESEEFEYQKISRRIQTYRTAWKLSLPELAVRRGIGIFGVSKIVNGKSEPAQSNLFKTSGILGCTMRAFFKYGAEKGHRAGDVVRAVRIVKKIEVAGMSIP